MSVFIVAIQQNKSWLEKILLDTDGTATIQHKYLAVAFVAVKDTNAIISLSH